MSKPDAGRSRATLLRSRLLRPRRFCSRASGRLWTGLLRPRFALCGFMRTRVRGGAVRYGRRPARAKIIRLPLKVGDEIVGDVDLDDALVAALPECSYGFLCGVHLAIKLPLQAAEPFELGLGLVDLLGKIGLWGLGLGCCLTRRCR